MSYPKLVISRQALERMVRYLTYLRSQPEEAPTYISATAIAEALSLHQVQVRKDLAIVGSEGKPKVGYVRKDLLRAIERFLDYDNLTDAVLVGVGNLGKALLSYQGFADYGLNIVMGFDVQPELIGSEVQGKRILSVSRVAELCRRLNVHIGIITVPAAFAQTVCDDLVAGGVRAIWNFTPAILNVPEQVVVKNENMAASFVIISKMLEENIEKYGLD